MNVPFLWDTNAAVDLPMKQKQCGYQCVETTGRRLGPLTSSTAAWMKTATTPHMSIKTKRWRWRIPNLPTTQHLSLMWICTMCISKFPHHSYKRRRIDFPSCVEASSWTETSNDELLNVNSAAKYGKRLLNCLLIYTMKWHWNPEEILSCLPLSRTDAWNNTLECSMWSAI